MPDDLKPTEGEELRDEDLEDVTGGYFPNQAVIGTNGQSQVPTDGPNPC